MVLQINTMIKKAQERVRVKQKWEKQLASYHEELQASNSMLKELKEKLQMENHDVEKLEGISITSLFLTILGTKEERLKLEKQEAVLAKLKFDEAKAEIKDLEHEIEAVHTNLQNVINADKELEQLLKEKEEYMKVISSDMNSHLTTLDEQANQFANLQLEMEEAIFVGKAVKASLSQAASSLQSAKGWGTLDMFGGGVLSTAVKHNHLDDASNYMHEAQHLAKKLKRELEDIGAEFSQSIELTNLTKFADYFFDGLITDWIIQNQISDSLEQVNAYKYQITSIVKKIEKEKAVIMNQLQDLENQRNTLIQQFA
jgi:DNA repair exonuclease SbcCD ATPase subunit